MWSTKLAAKAVEKFVVFCDWFRNLQLRRRTAENLFIGRVDSVLINSVLFFCLQH